MTNQEIIDELRQLSNSERLAVIEAATRMIRQDLSEGKPDKQSDQSLTIAARELLADYSSDSELTIFTALDGEEIRSA